MKNLVKSSSKLLTYLSTMITLLFIGFGAQAQKTASNYKLIVPKVVAQGQTFSGTVGEETENGFIPLKKGSQIQVMGTIVDVGQQGRVDIPSCQEASGIFMLGVELISLPGLAITGEQIVTSNTSNFISISEIKNSEIQIWNTDEIVEPGKLITALGTNMDKLSEETLKSPSGHSVDLIEVSSSYFESQYLTSGDFPKGDYYFSGQSPSGKIYNSNNMSVNPTIDMHGPALKYVGQRGKITLKSTMDGIIVLSGGLPTIQILSNGNAIQLIGDGSYRINIEAGKTIRVPFKALEVGQYTVTARIYSENSMPEQLGIGEVTIHETSFESTYDIATDMTSISSQIEVISENEFPIQISEINGVLSHPGGLEYISALTDDTGILAFNTAVSGQVPNELISFYPINIAGSTLANIQGGEKLNCNDEAQDREAKEKLIAELVSVLEKQEDDFGKFGGICGTGLMEMARTDPNGYTSITDIEQQIRTWLEEFLNTTNETADDKAFQMDKVMQEIYEANKIKWGNYSGICGSGLVQMAQEEPDTYTNFLAYEKQIQEWLNEIEEHDTKEEREFFIDADRTNVEKKAPHSDDPKFVDERVARAFESDDVTPYRTISIRLGGIEVGITKVGDHFFITEEKSVAIDPETGTSVHFYDFTKGKVIEGELWYPIYLISLGNSPINLLSRIVDSSESLGKEFLNELMTDMVENDNPSVVLEISSEMLLLIQFTVSFEMAAMPQLGDHVRSAQSHFEMALAAAEKGDWTEAWVQLNMAEFDMAMLMIELWPGGSSGKSTVKGGSTVVKPLVEASTLTGKKMDEVVDVLRTAARNETNTEVAAVISKKADDLQNMASQSSKVRKAFNIGTPRPTNVATAAKDRKALEEFFGAENVNKLGRKSENNVLIVTAIAEDGTKVKQVWVRPDYSDYRKVYSEIFGEIPEGMDIDHIQSATRAAQQGYGYVLVVAMDSNVNRSWGSTIEKATVKMGKTGHVDTVLPGIRMMDQFQWWKWSGFTPTEIMEYFKKNLNRASD